MHELSFENQKIVNVEISREMKKSFIDYAMSVIVARALPDVRDGLKPVHRRILYAMYEDNLTHDRPYRKAATTIGNVLGRYHPHGDAAVYDALVRLAQDFSLRYPLIDGHGNFGSIDGDPPAAYRYTEARLDKMAGELMAEIEKDTVDFVPNFDEHLKEPTVVPSRFPNLLVNGSSGIAVGMATNIPPHNLCECIDALCMMIDKPDCGLEDICNIIKGPDFPTGGIIMGRAGIRAAYATGRGKLTVRAKTEIEEWKDGRFRILVHEIPYMVNKARMVEHIAELIKDKRIEGISDLRDESDRSGMRVVIELKRDANPQVVLNRLFQYSEMQDTFSVNMLALVDGQPKILTLREMLDHYLKFQYKVVERRTRFELRKARERAHILEGLAIACDNIDEVIHIIRTSYDDAKERLMERFGLSEVQAQAILDMRLGRLQGLEREKIEAELNALHARIAELEEILASEEKIYAIVKAELITIKEKYGDARRTEISTLENEIDIEALIPRETCVYTLTKMGYIKRMPVSSYKVQRRGGRGITAMTTRDEDMVDTIFTAMSHDQILFFTNLGRVYQLKGYQIPESSRTAKGMNIVNLLQLGAGEKPTAMLHISEDSTDSHAVLITRMGVVKRVDLASQKNVRRSGVRAMGLPEDDELVTVLRTGGDDRIVIATEQGQAVRFHESEIRPMGREAYGVRGIRLAEGDRVIGATREEEDSYVLTITENGYGKLTEFAAYTEHRRGGKGMTAHELTAKTGKLVAVMGVKVTDDIMLITDEGVLIRVSCGDIRICGRASQGVIIMRGGAKVSSASHTGADEEEKTEEAAETAAEVTEE